jgi:aspartyl-tRNA synthetase
MYRTHTCGALRAKDDKKTATLSGWIVNPKNHGGLLFSYLRDRYGKTQLVFDSKDDDLFKEASKLRREDVVKVEGTVRKRPSNMINKDLETGEVELVVTKLTIINKCASLPIEIDENINTSDEMRLKYRYLDLRRDSMQKKLKLRYDVLNAAREYFNKNEFIELETPMLVKSTPEGARDYVVPSRVNPGEFYALPQSPQLYKQILMIAGFDRYFQIARCMRDEDLRADRQPEHTQMDLEMSFVTADEIRAMIEGLYKHIFKKVLNIKLDDFPVFNYWDAMEKYGTDKPDLRYGLELTDVTEIVHKTDFNVFKQAEKVSTLVVEKEYSRKDLDKLTDVAKKSGAQGLAFVKVTEKGFEGGVSKFLPDAIQSEIMKATGAKKNSTILFVADKRKKALSVLGDLRKVIAQDLELIDPMTFKFCWVKDFPLFAWNEDENRWEPEHHMFSMPKEEFINDFEKHPESVIGDLWDCVLNGIELGSGSIRVSNPQIQERIMKLIGIEKEEAMMKFGFLLEAYKYGGPVHGGMGLGADRLVALMAGTNDIREVIAFPKNKAAQCPMDASPSPIDKKQLEELNIALQKSNK